MGFRARPYSDLAEYKRLPMEKRVRRILKIGKDFLGDVILKELKLIRVWTRKKGGVAEKPLVRPYGSTVKDAAGKIHSDFLKKFKYAIVERPKSKISKMRVGLNYKLEDGDILSIYLEE